LEEAVVSAGGAAAAMRTLADWKRHPQGKAVTSEALLHCERTSVGAGTSRFTGGRDRPLAGLRVLDLTRVLAGPVATRLLAGWGAEVLRIDPPDWDEPGLVPEVTLGKRCARIDLRTPGGKDRFLRLLSTTDVLVHGYRSDALAGLGLGAKVREEVRPGLVDVTLDAYGWTGPWVTRRGFDSLVQMSSGIADAGRVAVGTDQPVPLPVQALDHATGYLLAAAAIVGVTLRSVDQRGSRWCTSLARMAAQLIGAGLTDRPGDDDDLPARPVPSDVIESTSWGKALRLPPPMVVTGAPLSWSLPARPLGADQARWQDE
jgi:crotonobetainyl-CoA:carnitine CoA-transferase CaiB-like acyl-CoA transferase